MQEKNTTTPRVKAISKGRNETILALLEEHFKDGQSPKVRGGSVLMLNSGSRLLWNRGCNDLRPCGFRSGPRVVVPTIVGKRSGFFSTRGTVCVYAQPQGSMGRQTARRSTLSSGMAFEVPELKGGSEASDGEQADNVSNEALYVIGLHGSGDKISLCLQDSEMAKVALRCHMALDMLCQEMHVTGSGSERACRLSEKPL